MNSKKTDELAKYNHLLKDGYTEQYQLVLNQANILESQQKQIVIHKSYYDLVQSLTSEEQKRLNTLGSQLDILKAQSAITGGMFDFDKAKQLISTNIGLTAPKTAYDDLNSQNEHRLNTLDSSLQNLLNNDRLTEQERINIKQWGADERLKIEQAHTQAMNALVLSDSQNMFGSLASIAKDGLGEQTRLYRAMFAIKKGFAIARSVMAIQTAIAQASANPFPLNLAAMATVAAQTASIVSNIKAVAMPVGQAHDGIMSVPKSGTWNLEKGERVLPKHTAQNLDNTLNRLQGRGETKVIINNYTSEKAEVQKNENGDIMVVIGKVIDAKINQRFMNARRQGGELYGR